MMVRQCIAPTEIEEGDLVAFLDGEVPARVARHLDCCPACATELAGLRQTDILLRQALAPANGWATNRAITVSRRNSRFDWRWPTWLDGWVALPLAVAVALVLIGLLAGWTDLVRRYYLASPAQVARHGVATVVVTVEGTAEVIAESGMIIRSVATSLIDSQSSDVEAVVSDLATGRVYLEELVEIAPPRRLLDQIKQELSSETDNLAIYSPAVTRAGQEWVSAGADHNNYAVWTAEQAGQTTLYFVRSSDGGLSWGDNVQVNQGLEKIYNPSLAVDTQNNNLYVVWRSGYQSNANIFLARSTDHGQTWSRSIRVSGAIGRVFQPSLTVDDSGGLYVSWQNRDRANISIFFVHSSDGGETWSDMVRAANLGG